MISFDVDGVFFMYRVAGICIRNDRVLLCREPNLPFWYLPGGRVHTSESSPDALRREFLDEVGAAPTVGRLWFVVDNIFNQDNRTIQEVGLYFEVTLPEDSAPVTWSEPNQRTDSSDGLVHEFAWFPIADIPSMDVRPSFLKEHLSNLPEHTLHLVEQRG